MMRKNTLILALLVFAFSSTFSYAQSKTDDVVGLWLTHNKDGKIEVYKKGDKYFGKVRWGVTIYDKDGNLTKDVKNPDKSLREQTILGLNVLKNFTFDGKGTWEGGSVYDPTTGKTYKCLLKVKNGKLHVTGYVGFSWIGKTVVWSKINE